MWMVSTICVSNPSSGDALPSERRAASRDARSKGRASRSLSEGVFSKLPWPPGVAFLFVPATASAPLAPAAAPSSTTSFCSSSTSSCPSSPVAASSFEGEPSLISARSGRPVACATAPSQVVFSCDASGTTASAMTARQSTTYSTGLRCNTPSCETRGKAKFEHGRFRLRTANYLHPSGRESITFFKTMKLFCTTATRHARARASGAARRSSLHRAARADRRLRGGDSSQYPSADLRCALKEGVNQVSNSALSPLGVSFGKRKAVAPDCCMEAHTSRSAVQSAKLPLQAPKHGQKTRLTSGLQAPDLSLL
eukprot:4902842-Pleurochrysis_carterae.AAC.4